MPDRPLPTSHAALLVMYPGRWARTGWVLLAAFFALVLPLMLAGGVLGGRWTHVALDALVFIVGAVGLMLLTGVTGQISIGHAAFLAIGGFTAAVAGLQYGLPFWIVLPLSGLAAAAVGLLIGPFALRLKGLYLAIVTLGLIFVVQHVLLRWESVSGGVRGTPVPMWSWFRDPADTEAVGEGFGSTSITVGTLVLGRDIQLYLVYLVVAAAAIMYARNLMRSRLGRSMAAVGASEIAASSVGIRVGRTKVIAFALSSFYAGVAGAMYGWKQSFLTVDPPFGLTMSVEFVAMIFIGGIGTIFGAVIGAVLFALGRPLAEQLAELPFLAGTPLQSGDLTMLLFSIAVITFVIFEPLGLLGIWLRVKRYFLTWPVPRGGGS
ncbi:branched-chain amino acid ABC transporter permease [Aeromicrobium sp. CTD01-1L150]|uniref:branched-chain amino acid ABC transporter permease n=1 Tax=Aeromicrobium sp. CTD01-1L150 TaxID=3341830 RepID=UPI0035BECFB5